MTSPLSLLSAGGAWALIHGADLALFAACYFACGIANVWVASRILRAIGRRGRTTRGGAGPTAGRQP